MSTYQPPGGGQQPDGPPAYAQPQDPWEGGFEAGMASVPTDPIPQPQPYNAGGYAQVDLWSQQTVPPGGYPTYTVPPRRKGAQIVLTILIVVLLAGGGGFLAWYLLKERGDGGGTANPTASVSATATSASSTQPVFDPQTVAVGDCLFNDGSNDEPDMKIVDCSTPKSYKVMTVNKGADLQEGPNGKFDRSTATKVGCVGADLSWYGYKHPTDDTMDVFVCMSNNP